jgi:parallel beta-helix repeat protein
VTYFRRASRFGLATAMAVALLAALAPASVSAGGGTTRWVDNDSHAGPNGCGGAATAFTKVQKAVNASGANDTILVCPGTYRGLVDIHGPRDGLTIRGTDPWEATLIPPKTTLGTTGTDPSAVLLAIDNVDGVTIHHLRFAAPTEPDCQYIGVMVLVTGSTNADILGNEVYASPTQGECGYDNGILVADDNPSGPPMTAGLGAGAASAFIAHNLVSNAQLWGIAVGDDDNVNARIIDNSVHYYVRGTLRSSSARPSSSRYFSSKSSGSFGTAGIDDLFYPTGILLVSDSHATVDLNVVQSSEGAITPVADDQPLSLFYGIRLFQEDGAPIIRNNLVRRVFLGISIQSVGARIDDNVVRNAFIAIENGMGGGGNRVRRNIANGDYYGIYSDSATGENVYRGNTAHASPQGGTACFDDTSGGSGTQGTNNLWVDNTGNSDDPDGICPPANG